jgi:hypothetical protein
VRSFFGVTAFLIMAGHLACAADPPPDARKALNDFYKDRLKQPFLRLPDEPDVKPAPPPWELPLKQLACDKLEERRAAAKYLCELLGRALEDETSGKAQWRNTPYWGGGAEVPARDLRKAIAQELAKAKLYEEVLPVLKWYLDNEKEDRYLDSVAVALGKVDGAAADALRTEIATRPHPNAIVAADAIRQIIASKKTLPADKLVALCNHHRAAIREAARKLNMQQGGKDPGIFDEVKALRTEPVAKLMERVLKLMPELPAPKAKFVTVTVRYLDDKKTEHEKDEEQGWLVKQEKDVVEIYTPHGRVLSFHDKQKKKITERKRSEDGRRVTYTDVDVVTEVTVTATDTAELVKQVAESRKKGNAGQELSERGLLTGQFRVSGTSLFEAILGGWLYRAGKDEEAAKIILGALDSVYRDDDLAFVVRVGMGELVGQKMLVAFVGERDYPAAIKFAKHINELYPDTLFHMYAKELAVQLPRRLDDFSKLKLPTPAAWTELKKKLTRDQQIDYLCERMRLLNCFQMGQPGGYNPEAKQYGEPCGLSEDAAWGRGMGKTEVINPLVELRGYYGWVGEDEQVRKGLELTLKDVPILSKYLRENYYMLIVSFWRDFHPDRSLSSTRRQFASTINSLAHRDICNIGEWHDFTPQEIDTQIERINKWATENAHKTPVQLQREVLDEAIAAGKGWSSVSGMVEWLLGHKQADMYDLMARYLGSEKTSDWDRTGILRLYLKSDVKHAKDLAPKYLSAKHRPLQVVAALIVFHTGDKAKARPILGAELTSSEDSWIQSAEALLGDNTQESRSLLVRIFKNRRLFYSDGWTRAGLLASYAAAGLKEPYTFYLKLLEINESELPLLDEKGERSGTTSYEPTVAEAFAEEIVEKFAPNDDAIKDIVKKFPKTKDRIPHLKQWLQSKLEKKE